MLCRKAREEGDVLITINNLHIVTLNMTVMITGTVFCVQGGRKEQQRSGDPGNPNLAFLHSELDPLV